MEYYYMISLLFVSIILITLHFLFLSQKSKNQQKLPPGPKPWPFIGHIHLIRNQPHRCITKLSKDYGPIMRLKLGTMKIIVISSPNIAKEIFQNHDLAISSRHIPDAFTVFNHHKHSMVLLPVGPKWRLLRKIAAIQLFTNQMLDASQALRLKKVDEFIDFVKNCSEKGQPIEIVNVAFTTTLNLLSNTFFSMDFCSHDSSHSTEFKDLVSKILRLASRPNVSDYFPLLSVLDLQNVNKRSKSYFSKIFEIFNEIVEERVKNVKSLKVDVLSTLLKLVDTNELSLNDVNSLLLDLFFGGTDTTSNTLEWAMTELLREPKTIEKAQRELNQVIGKDGLIQESDISNLPYIQAIIKETLRLHPATTFLHHKAIEDVHLDNYYIPKNVHVWVNIWSIVRDPSIWENPESFRPERFLENNIDLKGKHFEFLVFGTGRRICPGLPLAYRMTHLMLAKLLHSFNWKLADGFNPKELDMKEKFGITLQKSKPLKVVPYSK